MADNPALQQMMEMIDAKHQELLGLKKAANTWAAAIGDPLPYPDASAELPTANVLRLRKDQFFGMASPAEAAKEFMQMRGKDRGAASLDEIYSALVDGGYDFGSGDGGAHKRNLAIALGKHRSFRKVPHGHIGLSEWYPSSRRKDERAETKDDLEVEFSGKRNGVKPGTGETEAPDSGDHEPVDDNSL